MSKKQANPKMQMVARMLRFVNKAEEVFIESCIFGQSHNQMIKYPFMDFGSATNMFSVNSTEEEEFGDYVVDLKYVTEIVDWNESGDQFSFRLVLGGDNYISINNEW
ncbi:hypothetical protein JHL18_00695 [Clostridium sp. YIM B02505]|uniref:FeS cluster biogenesis domain-containing protein n=1 Tax=Clostridium yunnanense TaxID=2800325 RepID=A0ABS1EIH6_9CLOT|nr:hypothetical protein [Clostridium yunnanense]MBK1809166.1 hypothetical protein [Clostridium yunnanense]